MADRDTNGAILFYGDSADPEVFVAIAGLVEVATPFGATRPSIDTTMSTSAARTFRAGRVDYGSLEFMVKFDHEETSHGAVSGLLQKLESRGATNWVLKELPNSTASSVDQFMNFSGVLTAVQVSGTDDEIFRASCTIKISGKPTYGTDAPSTS